MSTSLLNNLEYDLQIQIAGSFFLTDYLAVITFDSNFIFGSHNHNSVGEPIQNGFPVLLQILTIKNVSSFINNQLKRVYENHFVFFADTEKVTKDTV